MIFAACGLIMFGFVDDDDVIVMLSQQRSQVHIGDDGCCCCVTKEDDGVESEGGVVRLSSKDDDGGGGGVAGLNANDVDGSDGNGVCAVSKPTLSVQHQPQVVLRQQQHNTFARRCCHLLIVDAIVVGLTQFQEAVMNL